MKILRLKLVNFIGIKHGLGVDEIEIDFTKSHNKIIMLRGENGSGKSTIMSQLHPYKDSFDERKTLILDGKEGRKEIDLEMGEHIYKIVHIYSKNAQSFIKKDDVELNENGGVRTFEDIVNKEFGITKDFVNINKIGSNTRSFIDFTTTERKNYVGSFLNIDDILEKFKIVNSKYKALKKDIGLTATELQKYKSKDVIETQINQVEKEIIEIDTKLSNLFVEKGKLTTNIERDNKEIGSSSLLNIQEKIEEKTKDVNNNKKIREDLEGEIENIKESASLIDKVSEEIAELEKLLTISITNIENKNLLLTDINNEITSKKIELESLGNPDDLIKIQDGISKVNSEIDEIKNKIKANPQSQFVNEMLQHKTDINRYLSKFISFTDYIEKYYTDLSNNDISVSKNNISYFFDSDFKESFARQISHSRVLIEEKQKLLDNLKKEQALNESYVCQLDNLNKRPEECDIDSCPFIKDALCHKNVLKDIENKDKEIKQTEKDLELLTTKAENLKYLEGIYKNFLEEYNKVLPRENLIYLKFIEGKSLIDWLTASLSEFQHQRQEFVNNITDANEEFSNFMNFKVKLNSLKDSEKILLDSDSSLREKYQNDIIEKEKSKTSLENEINELEKKNTILSDNISLKKELYQKYTTYIQSGSKLESASVMLADANREYSKISALINSKNESETKLTEINSEISTMQDTKANLTASLSQLKVALNKVESLNDKLGELNKNYLNYETINTALSPTTGIPLIFVNTYLAETEAIVNSLLDISFGGEFKIHFNVSEKEFAIQVNAKSNIKADIKMASQGEIAITTISISLALIEQSLSQFNILCLDEMDGPLDFSNRNNFMNILESQINKLGIEQVFVISHNNAFDAASMDLILLTGHDVDKDNEAFMSNKTILFEKTK